MNNKQKIININYFENLLDIYSKKYKNVVKIWKGVSIEHSRVMHDICYKLLNDYNMFFYTEAVFLNKSRADIFCFNSQMAVIIEILNSEKEENIEKKKEYYPDVPIIKVKTKDFDIEKWKL